MDRLARIFCCCVLLLTAGAAQAQRISNLRAEQQGKKMVLTYDLTGPAGKVYEVKAYYSTGGGGWRQIGSATGAVGPGVKSGMGQKITWDVLADLSELSSDDLRFRVTAYYPGIIEMVYVEGGTFQMGSNNGGSDEKPVHGVTLSAYEIGKYEVTQKQWREVMGSNPSNFQNCDDCPVEQVSWEDVQQFLQKLNAQTGGGYRLPTEAEWEFAARGGKNSRGYEYAGGNDLGSVGWYGDNSGSKTHPVGQKAPNELGLYDMSGNAWEWCSDWYGDYPSSAQTNPKGPSSGSDRVYRGGSWLGDASDCRVAYRGGDAPTFRTGDIGFRLAR